MGQSGWTDAMSVGIVAFDNSHKAFFRYLDLIQAAISDANWKAAHRHCENFITLARRHGLDEENFLLQHRFPGIGNIRKTQKILQSYIEDMSTMLHIHPQDAVQLVERMRQELGAYLERGDINYRAFVDDLRAAGQLQEPPMRPTGIEN